MSETRDENEQSIIKELCISNGLGYNHLESTGQCVSTLEMFFSGYPSMVGLGHFPNLATLVVVGQDIEVIEGLGTCTRLKELWLCECKIKKITGLEKNKELIKLNLYDNKIKKIDRIEHLNQLQELDLSSNRIRNIEGLSSLSNLKYLNLSGNEITTIGDGLQRLKNLETLNLSGNYLSSFKELLPLTKIAKLKHLKLKDPLYRNNPVSMLCNYCTYILYHLPKLQQLDSLDVTNQQLRDLATSTVEKKKMYYNMRAKAIQRNLTTIKSLLADEKRAALQFPDNKIRDLNFAVKSLQQQREKSNGDTGGDLAARKSSSKQNTRFIDDYNDMRSSARNSSSATENNKFAQLYVNKTNALLGRIKAWSRQIKEVERYHAQTVKLLESLAEASMRRLTLELDSGGNVRFEVGTPDDLWYSTCNDLLLSRFCALDFQSYGICGIKLHAITRVHNRFVRSEFENHVNQRIYHNEGRAPNQKAYTKMIDYLFNVWSTSPGEKKDALKLVDQGFSESEMVQGAVPLTNSLYLSEKHRLDRSLRRGSSKDAKDTHHHHLQDICFHRQCQIVVSKVFLGKTAPTQSGVSLTSVRSTTNADSVHLGRRESLTHHTSSYRDRCSDRCECSGRQCEWFVFEPRFILPEYIVDFEYVFQKPASVYQLRIGAWLNASVLRTTTPRDMARHLTTSPSSATLLPITTTAPPQQAQTLQPAAAAALSCTSQQHQHQPLPELEEMWAEERRADEAAMGMSPEVRPRPRLVALTHQTILDVAGVTSPDHLTSLNLHGNGLMRLRGLAALTHLRTLAVSFNELQSLDDVAGMTSLERVDASFNRIASLEGVRGLTRLQALDVDYNQLSDIRDDLAALRKHTPNITDLKLKNNPWTKASNLYLRVVGRLKSLQFLNEQKIVDGDAQAASRLISSTRISASLVSVNSRTDESAPCTLHLQSTAKSLTQISIRKPDVKDAMWMNTVTVLNLNGQYLAKLNGVEMLRNLRWASFSSNCITKLDGIEHCSKIEELHLRDNCIAKLDAISRLSKLCKLDASGNHISTLEHVNFKKLTALVYLSLEDNRIGSLKGLDKLTQVVELYMGNNKIENLRELFFLKGVSTLVIVDLYGNEVALRDNYRHFAIFHLHHLKALDGNIVDSAEEAHAKEKFGGKLTNDAVSEKLGSQVNFEELTQLEFPSAHIKTVDLSGASFRNLLSVNLEHNNLSCFSGLVALKQLKVLCLNHNQVESIFPRQKYQKPPIRSQYAMGSTTTTATMNGEYEGGREKLSPVLENLEVLHLGYNRISHLPWLQLGRLVSLKALFLQGNDISKLEGLEGLYELKELVLDRNKIKLINENAFSSLCNLQELHMEENRIIDLGFVTPLKSLKRLFLGMNRIQEMGELEKLEQLTRLNELSVIGNHVSRRILHRPLLVHQQSNLHVIDGLEVTDEERAKAESYFFEQFNGGLGATNDSVLPGIVTRVRPTVMLGAAGGSNVKMSVTNVSVPASSNSSNNNVQHRNQNDDGNRRQTPLRHSSFKTGPGNSNSNNGGSGGSRSKNATSGGKPNKPNTNTFNVHRARYGV